MRSPRCAPLLLLLLLAPRLLTPPAGDAAVITGACDKDPQCGGGMCCAVSIWVKSIRICTPVGRVGDSCHPLTRKVKSRYIWRCSTCPGTENTHHLLVDLPPSAPLVTGAGLFKYQFNGSQDEPVFIAAPLQVPFLGRRMHHTCPCMPGLACLRTSFNRFVCLARK